MILRELVKHIAIAAVDQHVGDCLVEYLTLGNGKQMLLALGLGILDEVVVTKLLGMRENRNGNLEHVVESQGFHDFGRGMGHRGEPVGELGTGFDFDFGREPHNHVIEQSGVI